MVRPYEKYTVIFNHQINTDKYEEHFDAPESVTLEETQHQPDGTTTATITNTEASTKQVYTSIHDAAKKLNIEYGDYTVKNHPRADKDCIDIAYKASTGNVLIFTQVDQIPNHERQRIKQEHNITQDLKTHVKESTDYIRKTPNGYELQSSRLIQDERLSDTECDWDNIPKDVSQWPTHCLIRRTLSLSFFVQQSTHPEKTTRERMGLILTELRDRGYEITPDFENLITQADQRGDL